MNHLRVSIYITFIALLGLTSCLKKDGMNIDPDNTTSNIVELQFIEGGSGTTINSGMQYFTGGALVYPPSDLMDTANYNISFAGKGTLSKDLTVSIAVDPTKVLDNLANDSIKYVLMPDSLYKIVSTTATIKAGGKIAHMQIVFFPSKVNPAISYMLPIVIKDAQDQTISSNFSTIYFHFIGNPLAGSYTATGYFYHPSSPRSLSRSRTLPAANATTLITELGDLGGSGYFVEISVPNPFNTTTVQNVTIAVHSGSSPDPVLIWSGGLPADNPGYTAAWSGSAMCNNTYDPATQTFYLRYGYLGGTGYRVAEEWIKKN
ncbi:hypothetical protein A3860_26260 [Niastella vici]|uniref:BT-3987-like N-terminal domain-containing protein n=1 Tax=Niastella vici TaxID=1703345 RepID=A0A1V9FX02_9BACT|nr:DUF1735 domain-containing protein [Niastella vici]OQP62818.1 hypothetical protein A3860_26260 [Niastella vici]